MTREGLRAQMGGQEKGEAGPRGREQKVQALGSRRWSKEGLPHLCGLLMGQEIRLNLGVKTVGSSGAPCSSLTNGGKAYTPP